MVYHNGDIQHCQVQGASVSAVFGEFRKLQMRQPRPSGCKKKIAKFNNEFDVIGFIQLT